MEKAVINTTIEPETATICSNHNNSEPSGSVLLPRDARIPMNRCNLSADILGSLTFHNHPAELELDGVKAIYGEFLSRLKLIDDMDQRSQLFLDYMDVAFCLNDLELAGFDADNRRHRKKADYLRMARGWSFDPDGREAAVLKGWVQSRFGLIPRFHIEPIKSPECDSFLKFQEMRSTGIYNTNALDTQLDLLFTFCQHELKMRYPDQTHLTLYRGVNRLDQYELLQPVNKRERIILLNNLNSFTDQIDRAEEFGDYILEAKIPLTKIVFFHKLLPRMLKGENEYVVIGGVCQVKQVV